jgi:hypothetical protein
VPERTCRGHVREGLEKVVELFDPLGEKIIQPEQNL